MNKKNKIIKVKEETKSEIKDIFDGEVMRIWEDGECVYVSFPYCTVDFPKEIWPEVKKDFDNLAEL